MPLPGPLSTLYSLVLCRADQQPPEPRYVLPTSVGVFYVAPALRRRASKWGSAACQRAVVEVFAHQRDNEAVLTQAGFGLAWAQALAECVTLLQGLTSDAQAAERQRQAAAVRWEQAQLATALAWRRLHVAAHSTGYQGSPLTQPLPRKQHEVSAVLEHALLRLAEAELRERLALFGYKEAQRQELRLVVAERGAARAALEEAERERQGLQDRVIVLRGAILGDITLFSKMARKLLPRDRARQVQVQRWIR